MKTKAERKKEIEAIKAQYDQTINNRVDGKTILRPTFYGLELDNEICFATVFRKVRQYKSLDATRMIIYFNREWDKFDYDSIYDEINDIFGGHLKFIRYFCGRKKYRIVDAHVHTKFESEFLNWAALYFGFLLIRCMDIQFIDTWKKTKRSNIDNVADMLYYFNKNVSHPKYCTTDKIMGYTKSDMQEYNRIAIDRINKFIDILRYYFSKNPGEFSIDNLPSINSTREMYQTDLYLTLERGAKNV